GIAKATSGEQKVVAVIGDSTFTHMGMPGLLNAVYNSGDFVVVILDNRTTAMTGGQDHPGTGRTLLGEEAPALEFARLAEALGAGFVRKVQAAELDAVEAALRDAIDFSGPAVVIVEGPCVLQSRQREAPYVVDREACVACGVCLQLGCPAISAEEREGKRWPQIDALLCTGCGLCAQVCPVGAIVQEGDGGPT
ncbi:MAG: 4Fe-4S binding protein, partial [Armatimonadetes bacterium]|nr:4Fe-4S binding protein [Armatimonadota bacterium]